MSKRKHRYDHKQHLMDEESGLRQDEHFRAANRTEQPFGALNFRAEPEQPKPVEPLTIPPISWGPEGGMRE